MRFNLNGYSCQAVENLPIAESFKVEFNVQRSRFKVQGSRLKSKKKKLSLIFLLFHLEFLNSLSNKDFFNTLLCQKSLFISANNQCYSGLT